MKEPTENSTKAFFPENASKRAGHHDEPAPRVTSIPLRTALRIAREQQRSKSSRRKIFREERERYLDIVHLMKEPGSE